jgi:hypothetical protein
MQFAKDSFYMALRTRLAVANPKRTIALDGDMPPAILVTENEPVTAAEALADCFYVHFGGVRTVNDVEQSDAALMVLDVSVTYRTRGTTDGSADRGRTITALDSELLAMCSPRQAAKCDYTQDPPLALGSCVFWSAPQLGADDALGAQLSRTAKLTLFFYPEGQTA